MFINYEMATIEITKQKQKKQVFSNLKCTKILKKQEKQQVIKL